MKLSEFKIGRDFQFYEARYRCTDIGSRIVAAIRVDQVTVGGGSRKVLSEEQAARAGWFNGPPYAVVEKLFDENDQGSCEPHQSVAASA